MSTDSFILSPPSVLEPLAVERLFARKAPLEVDLGCGKGRFLAQRAATHPEINFLGIDRLKARLRKVDSKLRMRRLVNVRLLRLEASYSIRYLLPPRSVSTFYVFFPDPWPKRKHHRRRLFGTSFLDDLDGSLSEGGRIHVATDHLDYFRAIRGLLTADPRFEETDPFVPTEEEQTDFERIFRARNLPIGRCSFVKRVGVGRD